MKQDYRQLLKPEIINTVSGLSLISRIVVDGYLTGLQKSRSVGSGMEFSQYRAYNPGDDLRLMDWKMLARSGRYYIKQSEIESQVTVKFVVDASASMKFKEKEDLSKIEFARVLVASLAYLAQNQGDSVGLFAINDNNVLSVYPKASKKQYNRLLLELLKITSSGKWPEKLLNATKMASRGAKELIFIITDMYEVESEISTFIKNTKTTRNEVVVLQIMGSAEMDFDFKGDVTFEDLESGLKVKVDTKNAKEQYVALMDKRISEIKEFLLSNQIDYHVIRMDAPIGETLQVFLKERKKLR